MLHWNAFQDKDIRDLSFFQFSQAMSVKMLELDRRFEYLAELEGQHKNSTYWNNTHIVQADLTEEWRKDNYILELEANLQEDFKKIKKMSNTSCMACQ